MPKGVYVRKQGVPRPWMRKTVTTVCPGCGAAISIAPSKLKDYSYRRAYSRIFCSMACYQLHNRGQNHPQAKGLTISTQGYAVKAYGDGRRITEHRRMAERALGRRLKRSEVIHHINGDKTDNSPNNLLVCTVAYHQWLHMEMSKLYMKEHYRKG